RRWPICSPRSSASILLAPSWAYSQIGTKARFRLLSSVVQASSSFFDTCQYFGSMTSSSHPSKGILGITSKLKEAGNSLFKKGQLEDALEKYGYAMVILAHYQFEEECDKLEYLKLAICTLMNSALCFSKKKEFVEVGKICSIVLEFHPYNVKAMYRREMAALELGKRD
ncbi:Peptidyl-prolyl cis-trans isomerase FKBP62, partial [Bienertia sinuspersici]